MTSRRYRYTPKSLDLAFVFGALGASALPGSVLLRMMSAIGTHESAARNLLTTMRSMQTIEVDRVGRHAVYRLGSGALARYREIEGTSARLPWRGRFHTIVYDIPEKHRTFRDRFRYLTAFAGYGTLRPGLLISPEDRRARVEVQVGDLPDGCRLYLAELEPHDLAEARRMTSDAWDLTSLASQYRHARQLLHGIAGTTDDSPWHGLVRWNDLYRQLYGFQLTDPNLPPELLPKRWPHTAFVEMLDRVNQQVGPQLQPALRTEVAALDPAGLAVYYRSPWDSGQRDS